MSSKNLIPTGQFSAPGNELQAKFVEQIDGEPKRVRHAISIGQFCLSVTPHQYPQSGFVNTFGEEDSDEKQ